MPLHSVIVGTAGHIDHGKTALVKALTGIDADRLEEEKRRGITIDIGFAHFELADLNGNRVRFGFIDVPGHERFVRNMLAGIGGIDLVLLIIAADEGIKPQTREHFEICKLLGVTRGITVLTKSDRVSPERLTTARGEVEAFVRGSFLDAAHSPIIAASANAGTGLDEVKQALLKVASESSARASDSHVRLPIDRVFAMKGFGTVVTGTLVAGMVRSGFELELLPSQTRVRVRGVQVHNVAADAAHAGERTALNLAGVQKEQVTRGMTLVSPNVFRSTQLIDAHISMLADATLPKSGTRFHLHSLTSETIVTVQGFDAGRGFARLRLADPLLLLPHDRFILRQFSPVATAGGGVVLDAWPQKKTSAEARAQVLETLCSADAAQQLLACVERRGEAGLSITDLIVETGWTEARIDAAAKGPACANKLLRIADHFITTHYFEAAQHRLIEQVLAFHRVEPLASGISREQLRNHLRLKQETFSAAVAHLLQTHLLEEIADALRLPGRVVTLKDDESQARDTIENAFASAGLKVPAMKDVLASMPLDRARAHKIVTLLLREGTLVKLGDDLVFHSSALQTLRQTIRDYKSESPTIDIARFKNITSVSRKYAIPLLEHLDRERITRRQGDVRVIL